MNRRSFLIGGTGLVAVGAVGAYTVRPESANGTIPTSPESQLVTPATGVVTQGDLATVRDFRATISFGDPWTIETTAQGIVTTSHPRGTVIDDGDTLVRVADRPLLLALGAMPMYRTLEKVDTRLRDENNRRLTLLQGEDVAQLQRHLLDRGFDADGTLEMDTVFGSQTERAVKEWQESLGVPVSGRVDTSQLVFAAEPVRINQELRVGTQFATLEVTRADASVLVDTNNRDRAALAPGTAVVVMAPGDQRLDGRVESQEQTIAGDGSSIWRSTISTAGALPDASSATVEVREVIVRDSTLVPASALLALAEGGFAVEVVDGTGDGASRLVGVDLIDVLDGQAAINGEVSPGDSVVVPT